MTDKFSKRKRSAIMSRVRSRGTKPELRVKETLEAMRIPFEYQAKIGGADVDFFVPPKLAVDVRGCFWHAHKDCYREPSSSLEYWRWKAINNRRRDAGKTIRLLMAGYVPLNIWECEVGTAPERIAYARSFSHPKSIHPSWSELGYIVGLIMGDGSIRLRRKGHRSYYLVYIYNRDEEILQTVKMMANRWGLSTYEAEDGRPTKFGRSESLALSSRFLCYAAMFTKLHDSMLAFPRVHSTKFNGGLVGGFFDADGGWNSWRKCRRINPQARFYSKRAENLIQVRSLLDDFGIHSKIYRIRSDEFYLSIYRREDFQRWVGIWEHDLEGNPDRVGRLLLEANREY